MINNNPIVCANYVTGILKFDSESTLRIPFNGTLGFLVR